jgi:hypothetical protein
MALYTEYSLKISICPKVDSHLTLWTPCCDPRHFFKSPFYPSPFYFCLSLKATSLYERICFTHDLIGVDIRMLEKIPSDIVASWPKPNHVNPQTRGALIYVINATFLFAATLAVGGRLYTRIRIRNWFGLDDFFIIIAYVCAGLPCQMMELIYVHLNILDNGLFRSLTEVFLDLHNGSVWRIVPGNI